MCYLKICVITYKSYLNKNLNYIHVKLEKVQKREILPLCILPKREILRETHSATLILSINIQIPADILKMMRYSLLIVAYNSSYDASHVIIVLCGYFADLVMHFSWQNSIQFTLFKEKKIGRK